MDFFFEFEIIYIIYQIFKFNGQTHLILNRLFILIERSQLKYDVFYFVILYMSFPEGSICLISEKL